MSESKAKQRFVIYNNKHASVSLHETGSLPLGVQFWASEEFKFQFGIKCKSLCHFVFLFFSIWNLKGHFPMILPSSSVFAEAEWNKIWLSWKDVGRIQSVCLFCACKSFDPVSEGCSDLMLFRLISLPSSPGELSL